MLETCLDDISPELLAHASEHIVQAGALDVFIAPVQMKKGRPGFQLTALCHDNAREEVTAAIFAESTAIGLRQRFSERVVLKRETRSVQVAGCEVRLEVRAVREGRTTNVKPEFDDVRRLAAERDLTAKEAMQLVWRSFMKNMDLEKIKRGVALILEGIGEDAASAAAAGDAAARGGHVRRGAVGHRARSRPIF